MTLKIGEKVKFSKYHPKDEITQRPFMQVVTSDDGSIRVKVPLRLRSFTETENSVTIGMSFVDTDVTEGYYVGSKRKKIARSYSKQDPTAIPGETVTQRILRRARLREQSRWDRYSTNPTRMDNPRKLDELAVIKWKRRYVLVPMDNVMKHTFGRTTTTL